MIFLGVGIFLILLGVIFIDSRLAKLRKIELEILKELQAGNDAQREIAKALQWMVDNWKDEGRKQPPLLPPPLPPV